MDLSAKYRLRREKLRLWPSQKVDVFTNNTLKNSTEGSEARSYSARVELSHFISLRGKKINCGVPTFKRRRVTANPKQTMSSDKEAEPGSEKRTSPGRAVRGKLVNMVLYCTHDICFPSFIFSFIFFSLFWCEQQKLAVTCFTPYSKKKNKKTSESNPLSKQGNTKQKKKATSHKTLRLHNKKEKKKKGTKTHRF